MISLLALLILLAHQVSILFWQLYPVTDTGFDLPGEIVSGQNILDRPMSASEKSQIIARAYLFGKPQVETTSVVEVSEAPETQLNYKLRGIYYSELVRLSSAIIEIKANDSQFFRLDDELAENIILVGINQDHILINRYGKIERLNLEKTISSGKSTIFSSGSINPDSIAASALLGSYKKRYVSNPMALAKRFQAIPVEENGQNIGFKLKALRGESLLKRLNFKDSDVFIRVNGVGLDKPFQALDALKSLTTATSVSVTILRNGNEQTLNFNL